MNRLARFTKLPRNAQRAVIESMVVLCAVRCALTFLSYNWLIKRFPLRIAHRREADASGAARMIAWAIPSAARFVPKATCLTQALAAQYVLARRGVRSHISLGVKEEAGRFRAHAWLYCDGHIVIGGMSENIAGFTKLTDLQVQS